ncbi:Tryptophan synthase alpha chain [Candidatus Calditenuaceae archaeon HR02]|nr:Tryptophan synthase alpha chain [Candidatus Calditenuaceae archaeon HR02]
MSNISDLFRDSLASGRAALIGYLTAGDPGLDQTRMYAEALVEGGVDVLELGVPFSDPVADGVTIQASAQRALTSRTKLPDVLRLSSIIKKSLEAPVVILSYLNPIYRMGFRRFFEEASSSGVDGVVVPDLPVEESADFREEARRAGVDTIFLASPTTSDSRLDQILRASQGFVYLVSLLGVTGVRRELSPEASRLLERVRARRERPYLAVGFGVSSPEHVAALVKGGAEGVIVGSALVKIVEQNLSNPSKCSEQLQSFAAKLKEATKL